MKKKHLYLIGLILSLAASAYFAHEYYQEYKLDQQYRPVNPSALINED
jgi:hypothetical protein